jgi:S-DNA-T family DNA segregation ATPase FtsK/SpoIIIE
LSEPRRDSATRVEISPEKGHEIVGVLFAALAVLTGASLISFHPADASFLRDSSGELERHNWIGSVGSEIGAAGFGLLGVAALLIPVLLAVGAWKRLRPKARPHVVGRGVGAALVLFGLPGLLQLVLPTFSWEGSEIDSGGAMGVVIASGLGSRLNFAGALVILLAVFIVGIALLVQTSLGDLLGRWRRRFASAMEQWRLARARRRERREKEKARTRVVVKHLQRVAEEKQKRLDQMVGSAAPPPPTAAERRTPVEREAPVEEESEAAIDPAGRLDLPMRVAPRPVERSVTAAERPGTVRRVAAPPPTGAVAPAIPAAAPAAPLRARARAAEPPPRPGKQEDFEFAAASGGPELPPLNLLQLESEKAPIDEEELVRLGESIRSRCAEFGVEGTIEGIGPGPVITVYELQPAPGVKVSQIVNLQDDLALALKAESVRIDRIPGRSTLGVEVPNAKRAIIRLGTMLANETFRKSPSKLSLAVGMTIHGEPYYSDLATMPHLLIAGATGSGKSIGLQSLITSILYKSTREEVQFIFIDPKRIELGVYADIPHLKTEVVVEPKKAANALRWAVAEMERRYRLLAEVHVRSIDFYNRAIKDPETRNRLSLSEGAEGDSPVTVSDLQPLPYYVIVIDELADLMMVAASDVETSIARLAQMARAVGIHLIVATQRPSVDILTGTIKANFPCRMSFATASRHDSRTILDGVGAEKLLGKGDMLYLPPGSSRPIRLHGPYISEQETAALVRWLKKQGKPQLDPSVLQGPPEGGSEGGAGEIDDALFDEAARLVVTERMGSASFLQRRMRIGFSRAARLIDMMEREGLLGPSQGSKPRDVLVPQDYFAEVDETKGR